MSVIDKVGDGANNLALINTAPVGTEYGLPVRQVSGGASKVALRDVIGVAQTIKAAAGALLGLLVVNNSVVTAFVQVFDATAPTLGTTNPDLELQVPANSSLQYLAPTGGTSFATAIKVASTTTEKGAVASAVGVQVFAQYL